MPNYIKATRTNTHIRNWDVTRRPNLPKWVKPKRILVVHMPFDDPSSYREYANLIRCNPQHGYLLTALSHKDYANDMELLDQPNVFPTLLVADGKNLYNKEEPFKKLVGDRPAGMFLSVKNGPLYVKRQWDLVIVDGTSLEFVNKSFFNAINKGCLCYDYQNRQGRLPEYFDGCNNFVRSKILIH